MNDNDVIKALECCSSEDMDCKGCPYDGLPACYVGCAGKLAGDALDLINRLQAENERLQKQCEMNQITPACATGMPKTLASIKKMYATAKSEARKELAELITDKASVVQINSFDYAYQITEEQIDNLLKELDGKENENA